MCVSPRVSTLDKCTHSTPFSLLLSGLQYAEEIGVEKDPCPSYRCTLCNISMDGGNQALHFTSTAHRINVLVRQSFLCQRFFRRRNFEYSHVFSSPIVISHNFRRSVTPCHSAFVTWCTCTYVLIHKVFLLLSCRKRTIQPSTQLLRKLWTLQRKRVN